jgi:hypothetical protein
VGFEVGREEEVDWKVELEVIFESESKVGVVKADGIEMESPFEGSFCSCLKQNS